MQLASPYKNDARDRCARANGAKKTGASSPMPLSSLRHRSTALVGRSACGQAFVSRQPLKFGLLISLPTPASGIGNATSVPYVPDGVPLRV